MASALTARFHGAEAAAAPRSTSTRCTWSTGFRTRSRSSRSAPRTAGPPPGGAPDAFDISGSEGRRLLAQGGVRLDGEALGRALDVPAERLDGAVLQVGRRRFERLRER